MKTFTSLVASVLVFTAHASALVVNRPLHTRDIEARTYDNCTPPSQAVNLLRANIPEDDHFYTTSDTELHTATTQFGYKPEGTAAKVFSSPQPYTVPFFRLNHRDSLLLGGSDHFYTDSESERDGAVRDFGYYVEGVAAYVYATQVCGSVPFYRLINEKIVDHFYTVSEQERDSAQKGGYKLEGIAAYVLPA